MLARAAFVVDVFRVLGVPHNVGHQCGAEHGGGDGFRSAGDLGVRAFAFGFVYSPSVRRVGVFPLRCGYYDDVVTGIVCGFGGGEIDVHVYYPYWRWSGDTAGMHS